MRSVGSLRDVETEKREGFGLGDVMQEEMAKSSHGWLGLGTEWTWKLIVENTAEVLRSRTYGARRSLFQDRGASRVALRGKAYRGGSPLDLHDYPSRL